MTGGEGACLAMAVVLMTFLWNAQGVRVLPAFCLSAVIVAVTWLSYMTLPH